MKNAGYIVEDTDDWGADAANFNIKNLFDGVEKNLMKVYKKVEMEASNYDDEGKCQIVSYYI